MALLLLFLDSVFLALELGFHGDLVLPATAAIFALIMFKLLLVH